MIYILRTDGSSETFYKIGYTKREMSKRIRALQTGCPYKLELVKTMQGSQDKEKEYHAILRQSRILGEWYRDDFYVRETLGIYDWKGFPHNEFQPTENQVKVIQFIRATTGHEFWSLGEFLKKLSVTEDELRRIPFGERGFGIGLYDYDLMANIGKFHGEPFKGKLLCIGSRN